MTQQEKIQVSGHRHSSNTDIALAMEAVLELREKVGKTPEEVSFNFLSYTNSNFSRRNLSTGIFKQTNFTNTKFVETKFRSAVLRRTNLSGANLQDTDLTGADLSEANLQDVQNLTQSQFDTIIYQQGNPPQNIPSRLTLPKDRAYVMDDDGQRRFVPSDKDWSGRVVDA